MLLLMLNWQKYSPMCLLRRPNSHYFVDLLNRWSRAGFHENFRLIHAQTRLYGVLVLAFRNVPIPCYFDDTTLWGQNAELFHTISIDRLLEYKSIIRMVFYGKEKSAKLAWIYSLPKHFSKFAFTSSRISVDVNNSVGRNPYFEYLVTGMSWRFRSTHGESTAKLYVEGKVFHCSSARIAS